MKTKITLVIVLMFLTALSATAFSQTLLPDLTVTSVVLTPINPVAGGTFTVTAVLKNIGGSFAVASVVKYYYSTDNVLSNTDILLGQDSIPGLAPNISFTKIRQLILPASATGTTAKYIFVRSDATEIITEALENNNSKYKEFMPGAALKPDLTPDAATLTPVSANAGSSISVSCKVFNIGAAQAGKSVLKYYFSTDATFSSNDVMLGSDSIGILAPSTFMLKTHQLVLPLAAGVGPRFILFRADATEIVTESNETNNIISRPITLTNTLPDLTATELMLTNITTIPVNTLTASVKIKNIGLSAATASIVKYYFSTDNIFSANDILLGLDSVAALAPTMIITKTKVLTLPATMGASKFIIARADATEIVTESNETNNTCFKVFQIEVPKPDLIIGEPFLTPANPLSGSTFTISYLLKNIGTANAGNSVVKYYLSNDNLFSTNDVLLGSDSFPGVLPATYIFKVRQLTMPAAIGAGIHYIVIRADATEIVTESIETNNFFFKQFMSPSDSPIPSTDQSATSNLKSYPNPTSETTYINLPAGSETLELYNRQGSLVQKTDVMNKTQCEVDLVSLPVGLYFAHVIGQGVNVKGTIVKTR